jgi:subtilisin family serine protease
MRISLPGLLLFAGAIFMSGCDSLIEVDDPATRESTLSASSRHTTGEIIADQFIVVFNDRISDAPGLARRLAHGQQVEILYTYEHTIKGFAFRGSSQAAAALERNPNVAYVEPDGMAYAIDMVQEGATWGIDRIDQRALPLSGTYAYAQNGAGVTAYIIDSGIRFNHNEFGGRATLGRDFVAEEDPANAGDGSGDCNGHGTHVAGTVGGALYGVAKNVDLVSVRVFGCSGGTPWTRVIAAIDWVAGDASGPAVANMSLGGGANTAVDDATRALIASGVATAVAAGNDGQDACRFSPARVREAMTIGSTTRTDERSSFSNVGDCVDWFAPGSAITSAWWESDTQTRSISGTSMASPHAAGVAALYLQGNPAATPRQVYDALFAATTKGVVTRSRTANNHLLYSLGDWGSSGGGGGGGTTPPPAPAAPTNLNAAAASSSAIDLTWADNSDNESGFKIERCQGSGCANFTQIATVGANVTSFQNTGLSASTEYSYRVRASNSGGDSGYTNTASAATLEASGSGPSDLTLRGYKSGGRMTVDLSWTPGTPSSVDIWRQAGTAGSWERLQAGIGNTGSFTDRTSFIGGGTLSYQVCEAGMARGSSACTDTASWTF